MNLYTDNLLHSSQNQALAGSCAAEEDNPPAVKRRARILLFMEGSYLQMASISHDKEMIFLKKKYLPVSIIPLLRMISEDLIPDMLQEAGLSLNELSGIGIALPGSYNAETFIFDNSFLLLNEPELSMRDFIRELEQKYRVPVIIENDCNVQCLGEYLLMDKNARDLIFISLGSGLGSGLILDGKLRHGVNYKCGELGYNRFYEDYRYGKIRSKPLDELISYRIFKKQMALDRFTNIEQIPQSLKDEMTRQIMQFLPLSIANICHFLDCSNIVLGGFLFELLKESLLPRLKEKLTLLCPHDTYIYEQISNENGLWGLDFLLSEKEKDLCGGSR